MGCDIHIYTEMYNTKSKKWECQDTYGPNPWYAPNDPDNNQPSMHIQRHLVDLDRNYEIFGLLADVRHGVDGGPITDPKGLPNNMSEEVTNAHGVWDIDAHTHSYLTLQELDDGRDWSTTQKEMRYLRMPNCISNIKVLSYQTLSIDDYVLFVPIFSASNSERKSISENILRGHARQLVKTHLKINDEKEWRIQLILGTINLDNMSLVGPEYTQMYSEREFDIPLNEVYHGLTALRDTLRAHIGEDRDPNHIRIVFWFDN